MRKVNFSRTMLIPSLVIVGIIAVIAIALVIGGSETKKPNTKSGISQALPCGPYKNDKRVLINGQTINTEVPKTPQAQQKGLSGRPCILANQGMLFVFNKPSQYFFWMKDMHFPIDILWISADHKIVGQEIDVEPNTYPDRFVNKKENPALYVLELKSNRSRELQATLGTTVSF